MTNDLISRKFLLSHECEADRMGAMLVVGKGWILEAPAVDAVEVVRCGECLMGQKSHFSPSRLVCVNDSGKYKKPDDYCSYGERRESEVSE